MKYSEIQTTLPYRQWKRYRDSFYVANDVDRILEECRRFVRGDQYDYAAALDTPKPVFNICREYTERVTAKMCGTKRHISFVADTEQETLKSIDDFYEYQLSEMDDDELVAIVCERGVVDGTGVAFTSFDEDTFGTKGLFRGFLKREAMPFERCFFSDPYTTDVQSMRYLGFYTDMEIGAAKELIEASGDEERDFKERLIVPESTPVGTEVGQAKVKGDSDICRVYVRFFRIDGEVFFEASTQYCDLFSYPHALNPRLNESKAKGEREALIKRNLSPKEPTKSTTEIEDYATDEAKYVMYTKARRQSDSEYAKEKGKFSRYPISVYVPYPTTGSILGYSGVAAMLPNQKIINYTFLLTTLIMQNHAMPKVLVKPDAMKGQVYDNTPNQIITDYSSVTNNGQGWGMTRLGGGDAINSNLIEIGNNYITLTRKIGGFDNIDSESFSSDTSGYAYSQMVKQMNLVLELPQKRLWRFVKENARTDIMYFRHYVDNAMFFYRVSDAERALNEDYRSMSQSIIDSGRGSLPVGTVLPPTKSVEAKPIDSAFFDHEFNVAIEVEQGIAGSELTESQHYNQIWQYSVSGNIGADRIKALVQSDPAISSKTRRMLMASLEELEVSQLAQKDQQIAELQQAISQLQQYAKFQQNAIEFQKKKQAATEKAAADQNKVAQSMLQEAQKATVERDEGKTKSDNAKGISAASAQEGETVYDVA